jgi:hypothetical protein
MMEVPIMCSEELEGRDACMEEGEAAGPKEEERWEKGEEDEGEEDMEEGSKEAGAPEK